MGRKKKHNKANKEQVLLRWSFPRHGWYKLNVDGSYHTESKSIACGGVIRNHCGEWLSGFAANLGTGNKIIEAELWALYRGPELAWNSGWAPLEVETDSTTAVKLVMNPVGVSKKHPQIDLIWKCRNLLDQRWMWSLVHVYWQQNCVADCLAKLGIDMEVGCHYFEAPPPPCVPFLVHDVCRVAHPRFLRTSVIEYRGIKKLEELDFHMDDLTYLKFAWKFADFSNLDAVKHYSDLFVVGVFKWRILMYSSGNNVDYLSVYLDMTGSSTLPLGWARHARFSLTLVNQLQSSKSITKDTEHVFNKKDSNSGFTLFIPLSEFCDPSEGYLVNDTCIIEAKIAVHKSESKLLEDQKAHSSTPVETPDQEHEQQGPSNQIL